MNLFLKLLLLLPAVFCSAVHTELHHRQRRGTRLSTKDVCVDNDTAVRNSGATWLRLKGPKVEFCRCTSRGRGQCHEIPVKKCFVSKCYNGGLCKEAIYSNDFICQCPAGFSGTQCEIDTTEKCARGQGLAYRGTWSTSVSGLECVNWNSSSLRGKKFTASRPEANTLGLGNHIYCRNPDGDTKPWCYVYKRAQITWEFCSLPTCLSDPTLECVRRSGQTYRGTKAVTRSGLKCLPWDSPAVSHKVFTAWRSDAREVGIGSHNFCRNPDGDLSPWCHVYKGSQLTWELCDIPKCLKKPSISTLGPRAPTPLNSQGSCGRRMEAPSNSLPMFRIRGGQASDIREQPWQAAITVFLPRVNSYNFLCGGVLIDSCWILSAAHCFQQGFSEKRLQVVLGRTFRLQNSSSEQIFNVEKYWVHEQYDDETYDHDIALLKLKSDSSGVCVINSDEVLPACLPEPDLVLPDWTECEISGYGKEEEFSPFYSERIKRGLVRLWPQEECVPEKLSGRLVTPNMLCAGDTRGLDDACKGDSGGPLVCPRNGRMTLMGLISWGDGCGKKDVPGVYTRVTNYAKWISGKMRSN